MAKLKKPKVNVCYFIEWLDAYASDGGWKNSEGLDDFIGDGELPVWNLGWFKKETKSGYIFVAVVVPGQDLMNHAFCIPKGMIKRIEEVSWTNK